MVSFGCSLSVWPLPQFARYISFTHINLFWLVHFGCSFLLAVLFSFFAPFLYSHTNEKEYIFIIYCISFYFILYNTKTKRNSGKLNRARDLLCITIISFFVCAYSRIYTQNSNKNVAIYMYDIFTRSSPNVCVCVCSYIRLYTRTRIKHIYISTIFFHFSVSMTMVSVNVLGSFTFIYFIYFVVVARIWN